MAPCATATQQKEGVGNSGALASLLTRLAPQDVSNGLGSLGSRVDTLETGLNDVVGLTAAISASVDDVESDLKVGRLTRSPRAHMVVLMRSTSRRALSFFPFSFFFVFFSYLFLSMVPPVPRLARRTSTTSTRTRSTVP